WHRQPHRAAGRRRTRRDRAARGWGRSRRWWKPGRAQWPWCAGLGRRQSRSGSARSEKRRTRKGWRCRGWQWEKYDARFRSNTRIALRLLWATPRSDRVLLVAVASCRTEVDYARCPDWCLSRRSTPESVRPTRPERRVPEPLGGLAKPDPNLPRSSEGRGRGTCGGDGHVPLSTRRRNGHPPHPPRPARVPSFDSGERARASWRGDVP